QEVRLDTSSREGFITGCGPLRERGSFVGIRHLNCARGEAVAGDASRILGGGRRGGRFAPAACQKQYAQDERGDRFHGRFHTGVRPLIECPKLTDAGPPRILARRCEAGRWLSQVVFTCDPVVTMMPFRPASTSGSSQCPRRRAS